MEQTAKGKHILCRLAFYWAGSFAAARDRLSDLTSREGDWFMDELCTMSGNVTQMTNTLKFCISVSWNGIVTVFDTRSVMRSPWIMISALTPYWRPVWIPWTPSIVYIHQCRYGIYHINTFLNAIFIFQMYISFLMFVTSYCCSIGPGQPV